ncbi:MAG: penicillin-binding protein activator, partial [Pseudomonadales bacterium]|nr:penicillin-binding protein activator [Pseudomonadales bacterium]
MTPSRSSPDPSAVYRTCPASLLLTAVLVLTGCAASAPETAREADESASMVLEDSPEALLRRAQRSTRRVAAALRLRAASAYAELEDVDGLAFALAELEPDALGQPDAWRLAVLRARLAFARGDAALAQTRLDEVPDARYASAFDTEELVTISRLRAALHEALGRPFEAARERVFLDGLLPSDERAGNREAIWRALTTLDADELEAALRTAGSERTLRGWLELARIARGMYPTLESQQRDVDLWLRRWEDHPAAEALPERLARLPALLASRPRRIALLLPLSGPLATAGKAVRDGFVAAQLEAEESGAFTPALTVLDSAALGAARGYLEALEGGAELVVGPLARDEVDAVLALPVLEIPVLALNVASDDRSAPGLVQFGLLPEAEGAQLAERLHGDGLERALLLAQAAPWAGRIETAFRTRFEALGGEIVESQSFASTAEVGEAVAAALLVAESEARAGLLRRIVGT